MEFSEPKPEWSVVPASLKAAIDSVLGSPIVEASIQWGGFTPSANFRLTTKDGAVFFCKALHDGQTDVGRQAFASELRIFREVGPVADFAPAFVGHAAADGWEALLFEFVVDRVDVPPWTNEHVHAVLKRLAELHSVSVDGLPVARLEDSPFNADLFFGREGWGQLNTPELADGFASLFPSPIKAREWLTKHLTQLKTFEADSHRVLGAGRSLVHVDLRSDNILFSQSRGPLFVDWPYLTIGPPILDLHFFMPSLMGECAITGRRTLEIYQSYAGTKATRDECVAAAILTAGFFAARAHLPGIPALPRLRWIQQRQLFPAIAWMCAVMDIESPL